MDISAKPSKSSATLSSMERGFIPSKARIIRIFCFNKSFSRRSKKPQMSRRRFYFAKIWRSSRCFNPICWTANSIFFVWNLPIQWQFFFPRVWNQWFWWQFPNQISHDLWFFRCVLSRRSKTKRVKTQSLLINRFRNE